MLQLRYYVTLCPPFCMCVRGPRVTLQQECGAVSFNSAKSVRTYFLRELRGRRGVRVQLRGVRRPRRVGGLLAHGRSRGRSVGVVPLKQEAVCEQEGRRRRPSSSSSAE